MSGGLRYLVTGGAGFIGSHITRKLMEAGAKVTVLDNLFSGRRENIEEWIGHPNFTFIEGDVCDPIDVECDRIFHLACPASPPFYMKDPVHTLETCVVGTLNMLRLAKKNNARMVYTSTSEVYGDPEVHPQPETYVGHVNCRGPRACYDEGKRAAETLCYEYHRMGVKIQTARLFNCYGPGMSPIDGRVVSNLIMQALNGEELTIYGTGEQTRSFTFVEDTVRGLMTLMETDVEGAVNIGNPGEFTISEFAELVRQKINPELKIIHKDAAVDDPKQRKPVIAKAEEVLRWHPEIPLTEGLDRTIPYFRSFVQNTK